MFDAQKLAASVQQNCHISDAQFAGNYTLCVFLLKMREYFRWEQGIPLSQPLPKTILGEWLTAREEKWDRLESESFTALSIDGEQFEPFASEAINQRLNARGYVYSAGYGLYQKPCFFLARLDRTESREGTTLFIAAEEIARDLAAPPAMLLGKNIFIRQESLRRFIWEKIEESRQGSQVETPMARALSYYQGLDIESTLDRMTENEVETLILHESGEDMAHDLLGDDWERLLLSLPRSRAEFLLRAVRDNLADCISTLPALNKQPRSKLSRCARLSLRESGVLYRQFKRLGVWTKSLRSKLRGIQPSEIKRNNVAALHFYFANFTGMRKEIFPAALDAYHHWLESGNLAALNSACESGHRHWHAVPQNLLRLYQSSTNQLAADIEKRCLPL